MVSSLLPAQDWKAAGHSGDWLSSDLFRILPWVFVALVVLLIVQALVTRRRYRAVDVLTAADQERVRVAIREIEDATSGDIVPLVVERSDPQTHTLLLAGASLALLGNLMLLGWLPQQGFLALGAAEIALFTLCLGVAALCPDLRRWFLTRRRADATAGEQALIEMARLAQNKDSPPLVLLFVSLLEHRVIVLANAAAAGTVAPESWPKAVEAVLEGVRSGRLAEGIAAGVQACAAEMKLAFPHAGPRENSFADRAITRRE
ncbi:MAG: hypothetical protein ABI054_06460 [Planctomycetota bacterium]